MKDFLQMIIIKNKFGNIALDLSEKHIIVRLSGGFDSSLLLYILASEVSKHNLDTIIHPCSVKKVGNEENESGLDKFDPQETVTKIVNYVRNAFPNVTILDPLFNEVDTWWIESNFLEAQSAFRHNLHKELNVGRIIDYTGVTKNPDMVIGQDFLPELDENNNEIIVHRNPEKHRDTIVIPFIENTVSVIKKFENESFLNPFRNADKRITFSLASDYGILDFLLENTRSCEGRRQQTHNFTTVCYRDIRCWWCHEREWALNNYDK
jgi:hypothetical protein